MIAAIAIIAFSDQDGASAARTATKVLRGFDVNTSAVGRPTRSSRGWDVRYDGSNSVFVVFLGPTLKLRGITWSATSGAYRAPARKTWALPDKRAAKTRLDQLGKKLVGRYPVKWQEYSYDQRKPSNLAFRAVAYQHFSVNGHHVFSPNVGYALTLSPIDGELRGLWISDEVPPVVPGAANLTGAAAQDVVRHAVPAAAIARGWTGAELGYYLIQGEKAARLVWRMPRKAPLALLSMKSPMFFEVDYVDAIEGRYLFTKTRWDSAEYWSAPGLTIPRPH
jgi:hypothetical protein